VNIGNFLISELHPHQELREAIKPFIREEIWIEGGKVIRGAHLLPNQVYPLCLLPNQVYPLWAKTRFTLEDWLAENLPMFWQELLSAFYAYAMLYKDKDFMTNRGYGRHDKVREWEEAKAYEARQSKEEFEEIEISSEGEFEDEYTW
jgi:hypothetical protein